MGCLLSSPVPKLSGVQPRGERGAAGAMQGAACPAVSARPNPRTVRIRYTCRCPPAGSPPCETHVAGAIKDQQVQVAITLTPEKAGSWSGPLTVELLDAAGAKIASARKDLAAIGSSHRFDLDVGKAKAADLRLRVSF